MGVTTDLMKSRIKSLLHDDLARVEEFLRADVASQVDLIEGVGSHITAAGGKRLRPILLLLAARLAGYAGDRAVNLAAVVELIHTTTLLHDDVIDQATFRRGVPSTNVVHGNKASVLVGDYLYAKAFARMAADGDLEVIRTLIDATVMMAEGEVRQLRMCRSLSLDEGEYFMVVDRKTARLIAACCRIGGLLGEESPDAVEALTQYGYNLGLAYQIADDSLDYVADQAVLGKALGSDLMEGKVTLPLIYLIRALDGPETIRVERMVSVTEPTADDLAWVISLMRERKTAEQALATAAQYAERAVGFLDRLPAGDVRDLLVQVARFATARNS